MPFCLRDGVQPLARRKLMPVFWLSLLGVMRIMCAVIDMPSFYSTLQTKMLESTRKSQYLA